MNQPSRPTEGFGLSELIENPDIAARVAEYLQRKESGWLTEQELQPLPEPAVQCKTCHDVGYLAGPIGPRGAAQGHVECPDCDRAKEGRRERLMRQLAPLAPIKPPYDRYTFDEFPARTPVQARACQTLRALATGGPTHVLLIGNVGSGKTSLGTCLYRAWLDAGTPGMWWEFPKMLDHIRAGFDRETRTYRATDMMSVIYQAPLLFLDDIGAEKTTEWAAGELYKILSERELRPTIVTSNLGLDRLCAQFMAHKDDPQGERIASRLEGMCGEHIYRFEGNGFPDLRQRPKRETA